jgi:tripartite-type tricarboxylate transporter receptor subunit TctC
MGQEGKESMSARTIILGTLLAAAAVAQVTFATAEQYPDKPIRLIVPFPPGGVADIWARRFGQELVKAWGQQVVIDNRPGAGTTLAANIVSKAPPDGYTIYLTNIGHSMSAGLYRKLPYDVLNDFAPITIVGDVTSVLAANLALPASSAKELIAYAKSKPGQINFASAGNGTASHLYGEYMKLLANIDLVHVPYKGTAPALSDLLAGRVSLIIEPMPSILPHIKAGKLKALGVTTAKRAAAAPDMPSLAESGLPGFDVSTWYGMLAPVQTPAAIIKKLNDELVRSVKSKEMRERFAAEGAEPVGNTPKEFHAIIKVDIERWSKVIQKAGITIN